MSAFSINIYILYYPKESSSQKDVYLHVYYFRGYVHYKRVIHFLDVVTPHVNNKLRKVRSLKQCYIIQRVYGCIYVIAVLVYNTVPGVHAAL